MKKLKDLQEKYLNTEISAQEILKEIFDTYLITNKVLELWNLKIEYADYGLYKLRENEEVIYESDEMSCYDFAAEIIKRNGKKVWEL